MLFEAKFTVTCYVSSGELGWIFIASCLGSQDAPTPGPPSSPSPADCHLANFTSGFLLSVHTHSRGSPPASRCAYQQRQAAKCTPPARTSPTSSSRVCPTQRPASPHSLLTSCEPAISKPGCTPLPPRELQLHIPHRSEWQLHVSIAPAKNPAIPALCLSPPSPNTRTLASTSRQHLASASPSLWSGHSVPGGHSAATLWAQDHLRLREPAWSSLESSHRLTGTSDLVSRTESTLAERKGSGRDRRRKTIPRCHMKPDAEGPSPKYPPSAQGLAPNHARWSPARKSWKGSG